MNLAQALEQLYTAFADVPKPVTLDGCPCCTDPAHLHRMVSTPLRLLTVDDLAKYGVKATTTIGDGRDYLYYLPRLLEAVSAEVIGCDAEIILGRLRSGGCPLTVQQHEAVSDFLHAWWAELLASEDNVCFKVNAVLTSVHLFGEPWASFLREWDTAPLPQATHQLAWFIKSDVHAMDDVRQFNAFLDTAAGQELAALRSWLLRPEIARRLEVAFFADPDGPVAQDISDALLYLGNPS